ncbi:MAG: Uma2 family endonuclease [Sodalinema sp.]|jgi:Uma2 family endonuclease|uniref:Uma2 family endonuclease n=1 Tax=Sodalinema sp. TaxID=3080550 RepID=UPI00120F53F6|nr:MAG: Uma2 family endonuclease [Phormidium sp. SL48-SHIP]
MVETIQKSLSLTDFLERPETKPASEYINGKISQKPMPQGEHSRLQYKLCLAINAVTEPAKIALAFPELRCTFADRSLVPDIAVFRWQRIPKTDSGRIANRFNTYPDWMIEILSPQQSTTQVLNKLLQACQQGTQLGWLINPEEATVLVISENQRLDVFSQDDQLPVLEGIDLSVTVGNILEWLTI